MITQTLDLIIGTRNIDFLLIFRHIPYDALRQGIASVYREKSQASFPAQLNAETQTIS